MENFLSLTKVVLNIRYIHIHLFLVQYLQLLSYRQWLHLLNLAFLISEKNKKFKRQKGSILVTLKEELNTTIKSSNNLNSLFKNNIKKYI